ncbi:MAG: radical SAM protein, partial [Pseudomonadota bacterium]
LMPHLHLSLQAGDDMILKRMKRRHLRDDAIRFCEDMRTARPDIVFGADIIAGFPTETEAMFENSLDLVAACGLTWLHVFPYSARQGTPAARMPQLEKSVVRDRAARLREVGAAHVSSHLARQIGRALPVLMETEHRGRTPDFSEVDVAAAQTPGTIVPLEISGTAETRLRA